AQSVTTSIENLLKISYDVFSRAVYSEQNQLDQFLNIPKGQRMERIDKLLKIDRFELARKTAGKVLNQLSEELSSKQVLSQDILAAEELETLKELEAEKLGLEQKIQNLIVEQKHTLVEQSELEVKLQGFEEKFQHLNRLKMRKEGLTERIASSKDRYLDFGIDEKDIASESVESKQSKLDSAIQNLEAARKKIRELEQKKAGANSTIEVLDSELSAAKTELGKTQAAGLSVHEILDRKEAAFPESEEEKTVREQFERLKINYPTKQAISDKIKEQEFRSVEFQKKTESCNERRRNHKEIISKLQHNENCPLCESNISGEKKHEILHKNNLSLEQIGQELTNLNAMIFSAKEKREELAGSLQQWESLEGSLEKIRQEKTVKIDKILSLAQRFSDLQKKKKEILSAMEAIELELTPLTESYSDEKLECLKKERETLSNIQKAIELKKSISDMSRQLSELESQISSVSVDESVLKTIREKQGELIRRNEHQKTQLTASRLLLEEKKKRFDDLNRKRELAAKYKQDIEKIKQGRELLEIFQTALRKTQETLRAEFIESVNQIMSDVWQHLYPYDDLSGVKLIVDAGDYVLSAHTSQGWVNVEGRVSGGERSLACLALRVAFSLALAPNLSWLILDEPTHNLDVTAIDMLGETLRERLPQLIEQIFLITHEERLESAVSGQLYKLERNKELDEPTRIVK
ncbi:MAG: hypothetical protein ABIF92_03150, partial [archaeon]